MTRLRRMDSQGPRHAMSVWHDRVLTLVERTVSTLRILAQRAGWPPRRPAFVYVRSHRDTDRRATVMLEYFILFALMVLLTMIVATAFDDNMAGTMRGYFRNAAAHMSH